MFDYLAPRNGPVFEGLEGEEVIYAEDQPQYIPLRTLVSKTPERCVISRWSLTDAQRKKIADGGDLFLMLYTFGQPLQPINLAIGDGKEDREWVRKCLLGQWEVPNAQSV